MGNKMSDADYAAILLNIYSLLLGFTVAAMCASVSALVTGHNLRFEMSRTEVNLSMLLGAGARIVAGPFLILRNSLRAMMIKGREPYWVMMSIIIAAFWSFCQGVIILETVCKLGACSG